MLAAAQADIRNAVGADTRIETIDGKPNIGYWTDDRVSVSWVFHVDVPGTFAVVADYAGLEESRFAVRPGQEELQAWVGATGGYERFRPVTLGWLRIDRAGDVTLTIVPKSGAWKPINLRSIALEPTGE